ncbi:Hydrogen peroxide-inducible genes activator [bacterium YEK0313]|nr:Hydrogen peroxide-inducible genes activator [bacterium YEK0313]
MKALDVEAVQAFVLTAELKSFTRAAEALAMTQSAVSLKIKRLEDGLGRRLLERTPRQVRLSADGDLFLKPARDLVAAHEGAMASFAGERRRLVVGLSHHVVGAELPVLLKRMSAAEPGLILELRINTSRELLDDLDSGQIDAAVVLDSDSRRLDGEPLVDEVFGWMAMPDFEQRPGEPLRLATQADNCSVRGMAVGALDGAGIAWTEVFVGGGILTIGAAVAAGLAIAALGRRVAPAGAVDRGPELGLPPLPTRSVVLHTSLTDARARRALRNLSAAVRASAG